LFAAALGATIVIFVRKENKPLTSVILGFAAGVILMVSFLELIYPAIHLAENYSLLPEWFIVPVFFSVGFLGTILLDMYISRITEKGASGGYKYKHGALLLGALSLHNIPEGLALGILIAALSGSPLAVIPVVLAVGLHKVPEGTAISIAFQSDGLPKLKSFLLGQVSGLLGFLSGVVGLVIAINIEAALPYVMSFAGGAMICVVLQELIPKSRKHTSAYLSAVSVFLGILLMLVIGTTLHDHAHGHGHGHSHGVHSHGHEPHDRDDRHDEHHEYHEEHLSEHHHDEHD